MHSNNLSITTVCSPGIVTFSNFAEVKEKLKTGLKQYGAVPYSIERMDIAIADRDELKNIKKLLTDKKKEIEKAYNAPFEDVQKKLDELIELVKVPFKIADDFIKENDKLVKKREIMNYAKNKAVSLGDYAEKVLNSPAFFNERWLNATYRDKQWQRDVDEIISSAADNIQSIRVTAGSNTSALLAHYYQTLSMDGVKNFIRDIDEASAETESDATLCEPQTTEKQGVVGFKTLKIFGTQNQFLTLETQLDILGMDYEEIEDGMPKLMKETTVTDFDSFVAFDIEHSGTFGAANGDAESEIIEIGAVKFVNGQLVDKFDMLCNPGRKITPMVERLTHITNEMVANEPSVDEVIRVFKKFVGDYILVGHNIKGCDIPHISRAANKAGIVFDNLFLDTKPLAIKLNKTLGLKDVKLTTLSDYYGVTQEKAHRAWCDAEANAYVYLMIREDYL